MWGETTAGSPLPLFLQQEVGRSAFEIVLVPEGSVLPATIGLGRLIAPARAGCVGRVSLPPVSPAVMKI